MKKLTYGVLVIVCASSLCNFQCNSSQQQKAGQLADTYAHSLKAIHADIDVACNKNVITPTDCQSIYKDLLTANQGGLDLNKSIRDFVAGTGTSAQVNVVVNGIEAALTDGASHIKDQDTLAQINIIIQSVNLTLTSVEQIYEVKQ